MTTQTATARAFPMAPIERLLTESDEPELGYKELARRLKGVVSESTVRRYRENGMTAFQADLLACKGLGLHPMTVWGDAWLEQAYSAWEHGLG